MTVPEHMERKIDEKKCNKKKLVSHVRINLRCGWKSPRKPLLPPPSTDVSQGIAMSFDDIESLRPLWMCCVVYMHICVCDGSEVISKTTMSLSSKTMNFSIGEGGTNLMLLKRCMWTMIWWSISVERPHSHFHPSASLSLSFWHLLSPPLVLYICILHFPSFLYLTFY